MKTDYESCNHIVSTAKSIDLDINFLPEIFDTFPEGIIISDGSGRVIFVNKAALRINDLSAAETANCSLTVLCSRSALDCTSVINSFKNRKRIDQKLASTDSNNFFYSTRFIYNKNLDIAFFILLQRDLYNLDVDSSKIESDLLFKTVFDDHFINRSSEDFIFDPSSRDFDIGVKALKMGSKVLLTGEPGVGKTEVARYFHEHALGADKPFVHVNCASIPESLFESELFGYERGAFTGAHNRGKKGLVEEASGGTIFLDEIGETPLYSQAKLLQFIETGNILRLGGTKLRHANVNIITATNCNLREMVRQGTFREDLFYRINVIAMDIAPLRKRQFMIPKLIALFVKRFSKKRGSNFSLDAECGKLLMSYRFPGNIRELQNIIEQLAVSCDNVATASDLPEYIFNNCIESERDFDDILLNFNADNRQLKDLVKDFETIIITNAIEKFGSKRKAAVSLGVDVSTIVRKTRTS